MSIPVASFADNMHEHQAMVMATFDYRRKQGVTEVQSFLQEWHRRARKTTLAMNLLIREACRVPKSKYGHIFPTQVQARNIAWDDANMLKAYLPDKREKAWTLNEQKMMVTFENGSILRIGGSDEPDTWRGGDFVGVVCDEWSLIKESLYTEVLRPVLASELPVHIAKYQPFRWVMFIYTPKPEGRHASRMFDQACCLADGGTLPICGMAEKMARNTFASRLDGELSGIYSESALNQMREQVKDGIIPQAHYDQEIKCARVTEEQMTLITSSMIQALNEHHTQTKVGDQIIRKIVSIDPAWGGDVCQIYGMVNYTVKTERQILDKMRTSEICMAAKLVAQEIGTKNFIVDTINDCDVAGRLSEDEAGYNVQEFKSSFKAAEKSGDAQAIRCANLRAQAYLHSAKLIRSFKAGPITDYELMRQLPLASRYTTQAGSGRLIIQPKTKIKEDLGRSPDKADCYIMGNWGLENVDPESEGGRDIIDFSSRDRCFIPDFIRV